MLAPRAVKRKAAAKLSSGSVTPAAPASDAEAEATPTPAASLNEEAIADETVGGAEAAVSSNGGASTTNHTGGEVDAGQPADASNTVDSTEERAKQKQKQEEERLSLLRFTLEECLSDWGLSSQHPELLKKIGLSETGYIHISNLLSLPSITSLTTTLSDVTASLQSEPSDLLELDDTGYQIKRKSSPDFEVLTSMTQEEWADRTFYLENLPKPAKGQIYTLFTLRAFLATLFDSPINAVRLPPLYTSSGKGKEKEQSETSIDTSEIGGLYEHESMDKQEKRGRSNATTTRKHIYDLPRNGGPFKGFAFTVVRDIEKARQARDRWSWDTKSKRVQTEEDTVDMEDQDDSGSPTHEDEQSHHDEEDGEDQSATAQPKEDTEASTSLTGVMMDGQKPEEAAKKEAAKLTPEQLCQRSGLCIMPIEHFNSLRLEYLQYMQDITVLREKEANNDNFISRKRRRSTSPKAFEATDRWERKPRSPSPEKWERKALSPERKPRPARRYDDAGSDEYPRGCVCFVKRIHPDARSGTLKALFQAILVMEEVSPKDHLQHVDHKRNVDSCHVRFSEAATASFFASYFSGNPRYCQVDPTSTDPSEAFAAVKKGETIKPIEAEVVTGIPEAIYWSMVPKGVKRAPAPSAPQPTNLVEEKADGQTQVQCDTNAEVIDTPGAQPEGVAAANSTGVKKRPVDEIADERVEKAISAKQARLESD